MRMMRRAGIHPVLDNKIWLYKDGVVPALVGSWLERTYTGDYATISNSGGMLHLHGQNAAAWGYVEIPVDLTNISTLYFKGYATAYTKFDIRDSYTSYNSTAYVAIPTNGTPELIALDVSGYTGTWYVRFGRITTSTTTFDVYAEEIWGVAA